MNEIIDAIDRFLATFKHRGTFTATEVRDLCLDIRLLAMEEHGNLSHEIDALTGADLVPS